MTPRSKKATKSELARYAKLKELPCIACYLAGNPGCGTLEIQHLTAGGRRLGNEFTIPLGAWHHRGVNINGFTSTKMRENFGPSFAKSRREFEMTFGSEEYLLAETNKLLVSVDHPDWLEIPKFLRRGND